MGILIGIVLAALSVIAAMVFAKKNLTPLSYIVVVVALIVFCIEGMVLSSAISARRNVDETAEAIQTAALQYLPSSVQDHELSLPEATGIKLSLKLVFPKVAKYIEPSDIAGHTIGECSDILHQSVLHSANHRIWMSVLYMAITLVISTVLLLVTGNIDGGGRGYGYIDNGNSVDYFGY